MLLTLLAAPPHFALPLARVKEALAGKYTALSGQAGGSAGRVDVLSGQVSMRVLYGCVAKRLVKIDRGGGQQVVRFDV